MKLTTQKLLQILKEKNKRIDDVLILKDKNSTGVIIKLTDNTYIGTITADELYPIINTQMFALSLNCPCCNSNFESNLIKFKSNKKFRFELLCIKNECNYNVKFNINYKKIKFSHSSCNFNQMYEEIIVEKYLAHAKYFFIED